MVRWAHTEHERIGRLSAASSLVDCGSHLAPSCADCERFRPGERDGGCGGVCVRSGEACVPVLDPPEQSFVATSRMRSHGWPGDQSPLLLPAWGALADAAPPRRSRQLQDTLLAELQLQSSPPSDPAQPSSPPPPRRAVLAWLSEPLRFAAHLLVRPAAVEAIFSTVAPPGGASAPPCAAALRDAAARASTPLSDASAADVRTLAASCPNPLSRSLVLALTATGPVAARAAVFGCLGDAPGPPAVAHAPAASAAAASAAAAASSALTSSNATAEGSGCSPAALQTLATQALLPLDLCMEGVMGWGGRGGDATLSHRPSSPSTSSASPTDQPPPPPSSHPPQPPHPLQPLQPPLRSTTTAPRETPCSRLPPPSPPPPPLQRPRRRSEPTPRPQCETAPPPHRSLSSLRQLQGRAPLPPRRVRRGSTATRSTRRSGRRRALPLPARW